MFFKARHQSAAAVVNDVDLAACNPIVMNLTGRSIVVFLERGVLYNHQVLQPGEAVGMTRQETAGHVVPYHIHAVVGDERSLPTRAQSARNLASKAVVPVAFVGGTVAAASSAGTMTGASTALGKTVSGVVVRGLVVDSAALAAGSLAASRASYVAEKVFPPEKYPDNYSVRSGHLMPGNRFVAVKGGVEEPLTLAMLTEKKFRKVPIISSSKLKGPTETLTDKLEFYTPTLVKKSVAGIRKSIGGKDSSLAPQLESEVDGKDDSIIIEGDEGRDCHAKSAGGKRAPTEKRKGSSDLPVASVY